LWVHEKLQSVGDMMVDWQAQQSAWPAAWAQRSGWPAGPHQFPECKRMVPNFRQQRMPEPAHKHSQHPGSWMPWREDQLQSRVMSKPGALWTSSSPPPLDQWFGKAATETTFDSQDGIEDWSTNTSDGSVGGKNTGYTSCPWQEETPVAFPPPHALAFPAPPSLSFPMLPHDMHAGHHAADSMQFGGSPPPLPAHARTEVDETPADSNQALPISIWRRMCMPDRSAAGSTIARRWERLLGKLYAQQMGAVPLEDGEPTSIGSLPHAVGKPCRPCIFQTKDKGCFDGMFCKFCHFSCDHCVDPAHRPGRRSKTRRRRRAMQ